MVEMSETAHILHNATPRSLVLLDEIGRGTSTYDGLALAWATADHIARHIRAFTLFATHYFELTALPTEIDDAANVHLDAVEHRGDVVFLHSVREGRQARATGSRSPSSLACRVPSRRCRRRLLISKRAYNHAGSSAQMDLFQDLRAASARVPKRRRHRRATPSRGPGSLDPDYDVTPRCPSRLVLIEGDRERRRDAEGTPPDIK